jgi:hypothetical protein
MMCGKHTSLSCFVNLSMEIPPHMDFISKLNQWNYLKRIQKYIDLSIKEITWKTYI